MLLPSRVIACRVILVVLLWFDLGVVLVVAFTCGGFGGL